MDRVNSDITANATQSELLAFESVSSSSNITDCQPEEKDLRMLVAPKVDDYHALGIMLGLDFKRVEMIKKEHGGKTILINMEILTTWIGEEARLPTTWLTLIQALREMDMNNLAHHITEKFRHAQT